MKGVKPDTWYKDRMRVHVDIDEQQLRRLDELASRQRTSLAGVIRQALREYVDARASERAGDAFGLWGEGVRDGLEYQESVRAAW